MFAVRWPPKVAGQPQPRLVAAVVRLGTSEGAPEGQVAADQEAQGVPVADGAVQMQERMVKR